MAFVQLVHSKLCTFKFQFEINAAFVAKAAFFLVRKRCDHKTFGLDCTLKFIFFCI